MAQELKDYDIMDIEAMDDERLEKSSTGKIFVTRVYIKDEVDAVLAEKDAEIRRLNNALDKERSETIKYMDELCNAKNEIERLTIDKRNDELRADIADATVEKLKAEIAELKESHKTEVKELLCLIRDKENNFNRAFDSEEKELRHQKYKRCLAMAKWCYAKWDDTATKYYKSVWYRKWEVKWLALAEKFKEAK